MVERLKRQNRISGTPDLPGDKSVSHRALLFGALAQGTSTFDGISQAEDVASTLRCLRDLGVRITGERGQMFVVGRGLRGLDAPKKPLDCGNSGTTLRLLAGVLAGQAFSSVLVGDESLSRRPMRRVGLPLKEMGAHIELQQGEFAPMTIGGNPLLKAKTFELITASAQVKSALLLAGLYAEGRTVLSGQIQSRDHTERLLPSFGVAIHKSPGQLAIEGGNELRPVQLQIPTDPSAGAAWAAAASLLPGSQVTFKGVSLNPTRLGFFQVLERMGAHVTQELEQRIPEPMGTLVVRAGSLHGVQVTAADVPFLIDELPLLAVVSAFADGVTEVRGAEELRVKETDRLAAVAENLRRLGAEIEVFPDGFRIEGPQRLRGAELDSFGDHRIAMAFSVAALRAEGETQIRNADCVAISYPEFFSTLRRLCS